MRRLSTSILLFGAALLAGCGDDEVGPRPPPQPARWRSVSPANLGDAFGFALEAPSPCRVQFRYGVDGSTPEPLHEMRLAAGDVVVVAWGQEAVRVEPSTRPPANESTAGRTEGWAVNHRFSLETTPILLRTATVWTRPGRGRVLQRSAAAPGVPEEVPFGAPFELGTVAIVDLEQGEATLTPSPSRSRLRMPTPEAPTDRATVVRLWMEVSPP